MYRSRLGNDLNNITLDYVSSIDDDSEIALYDIIGSQAHTVMLLENKIINRNDAKKILSLTKGKLSITERETSLKIQYGRYQAQIVTLMNTQSSLSRLV